MQPSDNQASGNLTSFYLDDGLLCGRAGEVLTAIQHLQTVMPIVGLRFSQLVVVPASRERQSFNMVGLVQAGCTVEMSGNFEIL